MTKRNIIYIILIVVIAVALVIGFKKKTGQFDNKKVDVTATPTERTGLEKEIDDLKSQIDTAKKSNESKDKLFDLYLKLGSDQRTLGLLSDARDSYKLAIDLQPNSYPAWTTIYSAYFDLGDFDDAKIAAQKALELNPSDWNMWRSLIELQTNQFHLSTDELKKIYTQALSATGSNINIVTFYAQFLEKSGDLKDAKAQWQKAIQINPSGKKDYQTEITRLDNLINKK